MPVFDPEIDRLLYDDDDGMEVGLDDETLDRYADAVDVALLHGASPTKIRRIYALLLAVYGPVQCESRLKHALLRWKGEPLVREVEQPIDRALGEGHPYMASQLLPVLARWDEGAFWAQLEALSGCDSAVVRDEARKALGAGRTGGR